MEFEYVDVTAGSDADKKSNISISSSDTPSISQLNVPNATTNNTPINIQPSPDPIKNNNESVFSECISELFKLVENKKFKQDDFKTSLTSLLSKMLNVRAHELEKISE